MVWNVRDFAWKKYSGKAIEIEITAKDIKDKLHTPITLNALKRHMRTMTIRDDIFEMDVLRKGAERGRPRNIYRLKPSLRDEYNSREQNAITSMDAILISEDEAKRRGSESEKEKEKK